jgi:predicted metalloprotease with PDZ domain
MLGLTGRLKNAGLLACVALFATSNAVLTPAQKLKGQKKPVATAPQPIAPPQIAFTVRMPHPETNLLEVEMRLSAERLPDHEDLIMPVWTPGSYLVREFAKNVQDFAAKDQSGAALTWDKTTKDTWRVTTHGAHELVVTYRVYCKELSVRTSEVTDRHAFWNNATALMYPDGMLKSPSTVTVVPFEDWQIYTGLPAVDGQANTYRAPNFDILYDSPFIVAKCDVLTFTVLGVPHRIVIDGPGNYDPEILRAGYQKIVETEAAMMHGLPYKDYTFFLVLRPRAGGGLEHLNSNVTMTDRFAFGTPLGYIRLFDTEAHEFFHAWNVKRIRPDALGPFDYTKENYTKLLWVAEGITEYYAGQFMLRSGLVTDEDYLKRMAKAIQELQNTPGRLQTSAEEASFDAWIKYYRPDAYSENRDISYYDKGAIVGAMLDLEIRRATKGAKSLDDVMRYLFTEFAQKDRNYTPADFQQAAELAAGESLTGFFARYVHGRDEIAYNDFFAAAGLQLDTTGAVGAKDAPVAKPYLGADVGLEGDRLMVRRVPAGTPAFDQGLNTGDQIVAVNGARVDQTSFFERLAEHKPGDSINLTIFRDDDLRTFAVKLGGRIDASYRILPLDQVSSDQQAVRLAWLGK